MATCNLAQAGFVANLADEYLDGMLASRALTKPFADACVAKLSEVNCLIIVHYELPLIPSVDSVVSAGPARQAGWIISGPLTSEYNFLSFVACLPLQRICLTIPDAFVSPNTWAGHASLLTSALTDAVGDHSLPGDQRQREIQHLLLGNLSDIQRRNDAMLFRNLPPRALERLGSMVVDIQVCLYTDAWPG